jgi:hypothetical protein
MISPEWRADLDALVFAVPGGGRCFVHRLAFRTLLGRRPAPDDCLRFVAENSATLLAAAAERRAGLSMEGHFAFHLTSRQIRRQLPSLTGSRLA